MGMDPAAETPGSMVQIGVVARLGDLQLLQPATVEGLQALRQEALPRSVIGSLLDAPPSEGDGTVERGALSCPIAPSSAVSDAQVFTDPNDSTKSYVLPRYAVDQPSGGPVAVRFGSDGDGWSLTVDLVRTNAPEIAGGAATAAELPHVFTVTLRFQLPAGGASGVLVELPFQEGHRVGRRAPCGSPDHRRGPPRSGLPCADRGRAGRAARCGADGHRRVRAAATASSPSAAAGFTGAEALGEPADHRPASRRGGGRTRARPSAGLTAIETNAADLTVSAEMPVTTVLDGAEVAREWHRPLGDGGRERLVQLDANGADSLQFSASDKPDQAGSDLLVKHWQVGVPLDAYLLGHPDSGAFQYTATLLWSDNTSAQSGHTIGGRIGRPQHTLAGVLRLLGVKPLCS